MSSFPDDIRPGPDLYGLPWEAVIVTALLGLGTLLLFSCRFYQCVSCLILLSACKYRDEQPHSLFWLASDQAHKIVPLFPQIKSRLYSSKERRMGLKVAELLEEKCKVLETLSDVQQNVRPMSNNPVCVWLTGFANYSMQFPLKLHVLYWPVCYECLCYCLFMFIYVPFLVWKTGMCPAE